MTDHVRTLVGELERRHPNLHHSIGPEQFHEAAAALAARLPSLHRNEALVELMRLAALAGERDGHTGVFPFDAEHRPGLHAYPILLYRFADGTFVVGERGPLGFVGARLVAIEGVPIEDVVEELRPLVPRDNPLTVEARLPEWLVSAEVLHGLGVTRSDAAASFAFETSGGDRREVELEPIPTAEHRDALPASLPPPARYRGLDWAVAPMSDATAVYMAYNRVGRGVREPAETLLGLAADPRVVRVVVDVRFNGGGDNTTFGPLLDVLARPEIDRPRRLAVLIGRQTFSAAANFAAAVALRTDATFVGEPTGGSPSQWGDATPVHLPDLGLAVRVATLYHEFGSPGDARAAIEPHLAVPLASADFFAGRDPILDAALRPA